MIDIFLEQSIKHIFKIFFSITLYKPYKKQFVLWLIHIKTANSFVSDSWLDWPNFTDFKTQFFPLCRAFLISLLNLSWNQEKNQVITIYYRARAGCYLVIFRSTLNLRNINMGYISSVISSFLEGHTLSLLHS